VRLLFFSAVASLTTALLVGVGADSNAWRRCTKVASLRWCLFFGVLVSLPCFSDDCCDCLVMWPPSGVFCSPAVSLMEQLLAQEVVSLLTSRYQQYSQ
jgi:hypothetical protein